MQIKKYKFSIPLVGLLLSVSLLSTTSIKLDEQVNGSKFVETSTSSVSADLVSVYDQLNQFADQANVYALLEHPSDEMMGPTRGTDWDDFGTWRKLHLHTWDASHNQIYSAWNNLNVAAFRATLVTEKAADPMVKAEAAFLRAFFTYFICDLWGQVPYRASSAKPDDIPTVYARKDAVVFMTADLQRAIATLPSTNPASKANKEAAKFLLAKITLNKAVFTQDPASPAGPFNFAPADMNQVVTLCNEIIASNRFQLTTTGKYRDNFKWDNATASKELIFSRANDNSNVFFLYADVLLMKAEAILRGGTDPGGQTALAIVNDLRTYRSLAPLASLDLTKLLAERGHELFYEGWRRNDQIRFGTFNDPVNERSVKSAASRVIFPIPVQALATNPNLKQNVGY
jgi:SusD family/Starch-binding associating with outer membrane